MSGTETEIVKARVYDTSVDSYLTKVCLLDTMGDVVYNREHAAGVKAYTVNSMVFNAVFETDVELIRTIALRIDGTVPEEEKREGYANILGNALEDVLSYDRKDLLSVTPDDPAVIAMAKVVVYKATQPVGSNPAARRDRNMAAQMLLERTGGRKVAPVKPLLETTYVEPDWMGLPAEGEDSDEGEVQQGRREGRNG